MNAAASAAASAAAPAPVAASAGLSFSQLGFALLVPLVAFAQLDAVANRLSAMLPIGLYGALYFACGACAAAAWLGDRGTRLAGTPAPGVRLALAVLLWACISMALSEHPAKGWDYVQNMVKAIGLLVLAALLVDTPRRLAILLGAVAVAGILSALIVFAEVATAQRIFSTSVAAVTAEYGGVPRSAGGSDENPTTAAHMLLVSTAILLGLFVARRGLRPLAGLALALCVAALALMAARSALIGLGVAVLLALYALRRERIFPLALLGLAGLAAAMLLLVPSLIDRFTAILDWGRDPTLFRRTTYLAVGFDLFQRSPIWGIGPGNFPFFYAGDEYRFMPGRQPVLRELHNTYLDAAVELGLVGFTLFLAAAGSALAAARAALASPALRPAALALLFALAALLVASIFMPNKDMRYLWLLFGLAFQCGRLAVAERGRGA